MVYINWHEEELNQERAEKGELQRPIQILFRGKSDFFSTNTYRFPYYVPSTKDIELSETDVKNREI